MIASTRASFGLTPRLLAEKLSERADAAWKSAGLNRITLHECRHTFASLMIAAGVNAKALSTFMRTSRSPWTATGT
jgi:integrase